MIRIKYDGSVLTPAGFRSVAIEALAEKTSEKMARVVSVELIDGSAPGYASRTGAKRQSYNGLKTAKLEIGKNKRLSACIIL